MHSKIVDSLFSPYLDSIQVLSNSEGTVKSYVSSLNHFKAFAESKFQCQINEAIIRIKNGDPNDVYRLLNEFVVYLFKKGKKPATIKVAFAATKGLLRHYGIKIYNEDVKQQVKIPKNLKHREEPLTKEILVRLLRIVPLKLQTVILVASSSGMRIGELVQLRISDINFGSRPTEIHIRAETTKNRQARDTFTTSEATIALKDYLAASFGWKEGESNQALQNTVIFGRTSQGKKTGDQRQFKSVSSAKSVLSESLRRYVNRIPELNKLNENGRRMIHNHAFRKYCRTVIGDAVGRDFAEALLGHGFYMDTYYNQSKEKRREMYLKAEPSLTISDFVQVEKDIIKMTEKQKQLEEQHLFLKQFIDKHFVPFLESEKKPQYEKNDISKDENDSRYQYQVSCAKCGTKLGISNTQLEANTILQKHKQNCFGTLDSSKKQETMFKP